MLAPSHSGTIRKSLFKTRRSIFRFDRILSEEIKNITDTQTHKHTQSDFLGFLSKPKMCRGVEYGKLGPCHHWTQIHCLSNQTIPVLGVIHKWRTKPKKKFSPVKVFILGPHKLVINSFGYPNVLHQNGSKIIERNMYGLTKPTKTRTFCQPLNLNPLGPNTPRLNPNPVQTQFEPRKGLGLTQKSWGTPTHPLKNIF